MSDVGASGPARWSRRWRDLFADRGPEIARRVARGRAYLRSGRVTDVRLRPGTASARVQGSRATPLAVEVRLPMLDEHDWRHVVGVLAAKARHSAQLLAGIAPEGLDAELEAVGVRLLPHADDLDTTCACADAAWPCAHVAAVVTAVADRVDEDPFALLRLRGRGRERLLADVAAARRRSAGTAQAAGIPLAQLDATGWTRARMSLDDVHVPPTAPPAVPGDPLRVLGDPPGWAGRMPAAELFRPLVERAAAYLDALERK